MNNCPYCQNEMRKGSVVGEGRYNLEWVPENVHKNPLFRTLSDENSCIILSEFSWFKSMSHNEADYCEYCKKIIIDIKERDK